MGFRENILAHLGNYKASKLGINTCGTFRGREYPHILPWKLRLENLLTVTREALGEDILTRVNLHRCFHHLNSSQAMCLNFFGPIMNSKLLKVILPENLANNGYEIIPETAVFEMPSVIDNIRDEIPTTFDFFVQAKSSDGKIVSLYVEIKFTETSFGKAKNDKKHRTKIEQLYLPLARLRQNIKPECLRTDYFLQNYQLMRNLIHIDRDSYVILIYPGLNLPVEREVFAAWTSILHEDFGTHLHFTSWENLITAFANSPDFESFHEHYVEFVEKYLPWARYKVSNEA